MSSILSVCSVVSVHAMRHDAPPPPQQSVYLAGPSATPAIGVVDHAHSGDGRRRWPRFKLNLFSGTGSAAIFASLALCLHLICAYSYVARRRAISAARRRFLGRVRDIDLVSGWSPGRAHLRPPPRVSPAGASKTPFPAVRGASSDPGSGPAGDCPVCLEPLRGGGDLTVAHECGHVLHAPCIQPWLHQRDSCPVCRCTVSCTRDAADEAATAAAGGGAPRVPPEDTSDHGGDGGGGSRT